MFWPLRTQGTDTVGADETERSLKNNCTLRVCAMTLRYFSIDNYVSPDVPYKFSLS
jgi:hypothetical protein